MEDIIHTDIAIIGAGLAGSLAAAVLGRAGYRVALVDVKAEHPSEFRVEKLAGNQLEIMERLGVLGPIASAAVSFRETINLRNGRVVDRSHNPHLGILYADLVGAVRKQVPQTVEFVLGRVTDLATSPTRQQLTLSDGRRIEARLVVLATGMGDLLRAKLNMKRRVLVERQSFSFGFTLAPVGREAFGFEALTCYGGAVSDRIDYLSLFPTTNGMRANLFTFLDHRDPWIRELKADPKPVLLKAMPGLTAYLGDFEVIDRVQNWLMDLAVVDNVRQAGVVLIGDAFQTSCPAAGTGVSRLGTDVEQLCTAHVPRWLSGKELGAETIAEFYDDPIKQQMDADAIRLSEYRRSLTVAPGLRWELHRRSVFLRRRIVGWLDRLSPELVGRLRALRRA